MILDFNPAAVVAAAMARGLVKPPPAADNGRLDDNKIHRLRMKALGLTARGTVPKQRRKIAALARFKTNSPEYKRAYDLLRSEKFHALGLTKRGTVPVYKISL